MRRQQAFYLVDGNRQVSVGKETKFAGSGQHPVSYRPPLASVGQREDPHPAVRPGSLSNQAGRGIGAAIVSDDDLPFIILGVQVGGDLLNGPEYAQLFVVSGNDNGEQY